MIGKALSFLLRPTLSFGITYGITVCNEAEELDRLLTAITPLLEADDEIVVLQDVSNRNLQVEQVLAKFRSQIATVAEARLDGDFATFKNKLIDVAGKDYLFQIDADEIPQESLIRGLKSILRQYWYKDVFAVPRINTVQGITDEHIKQWRWRIDKQGYLNYPDYQKRIFKLNGKIRWKNKLHEKLHGYSFCHKLPKADYNYCLLHPKQIAKQERQSQMYSQIER